MGLTYGMGGADKQVLFFNDGIVHKIQGGHFAAPWDGFNLG